MTLVQVANSAELRDRFANDVEITSVIGRTKVEELPEALKNAVVDRDAAYRAALTDPHNGALTAAYNLRDAEVVRLSGASTYIVRKTAYDRLKAKFVQAAWWVGALSLVIGAGVLLFAWGANPPAEQAIRRMPVLVRTPTEVQVVLSSDGRQRLGPVLGQECAAKPIDAVAIADLGGGGYTLAVANSSSCQDAVVTVASSDGIVSLPNN